VTRAGDEDALAAQTQDHLCEQHPGMNYGREEMLFLAC